MTFQIASIVESSMSNPFLMSENLPAYATITTVITTQIFYEIPLKKELLGQNNVLDCHFRHNGIFVAHNSQRFIKFQFSIQ